jgi:O-methyltransferase involved in polyketide biosynthesis
VARHPHLHYIPIDFLRDDIGARLPANGFVQNTRTLVLWEGVTNYLNADAVGNVFDRIVEAHTATAEK